jgi:hypothetical protein
MQIDSVSGELLLNNGSPPWWSFYDTNPADLAGCQGLYGPMAIVVSEETPRTYLSMAWNFMSCLPHLKWFLNADEKIIIILKFILFEEINLQ